MRYWWLGNAIEREVGRRAGELQVVDAGCHAGILRGYVGSMKGTRWIGLDHSLDWPRAHLDTYEGLVCCDFEHPLPLKDASSDVVVSSHVLEHLPRPQILTGEMVRVLRPDGIALIIVPILPKPLALVAERKYAREFRTGTRQKGHHVHMFWPRRLVGLARRAGLELEMASGIYLLRMDGSRLENWPAWIRVNQWWAGLCPSLGGEFCIQLRKTGDR